MNLKISTLTKFWLVASQGIAPLLKTLLIRLSAAWLPNPWKLVDAEDREMLTVWEFSWKIGNQLKVTVIWTKTSAERNGEKSCRSVQVKVLLLTAILKSPAPKKGEPSTVPNDKCWPLPLSSGYKTFNVNLPLRISALTFDSWNLLRPVKFVLSIVTLTLWKNIQMWFLRFMFLCFLTVVRRWFYWDTLNRGELAMVLMMAVQESWSHTGNWLEPSQRRTERLMAHRRKWTVRVCWQLTIRDNFN